MSEQNKQLVRDFIEAMGLGDRAVFAACLAPDASATAKGFAKISGTRGRDMMVDSVEAFKLLWPGGLKPEFKSFIAEGDRVVAEVQGHATMPDGTPYANQYAMVFTLQDGKIKQVNEYFCTILADEVMYPALIERGLIPAEHR